jgi:hypothetical protein
MRLRKSQNILYLVSNVQRVRIENNYIYEDADIRELELERIPHENATIGGIRRELVNRRQQRYPTLEQGLIDEFENLNMEAIV